MCLYQSLQSKRYYFLLWSFLISHFYSEIVQTVLKVSLESSQLSNFIRLQQFRNILCIAVLFNMFRFPVLSFQPIVVPFPLCYVNCLITTNASSENWLPKRHSAVQPPQYPLPLAFLLQWVEVSSDISLSSNASIDCGFCHSLLLFHLNLIFSPPAHAVLWYSSLLTWSYVHFLCTSFLYEFTEELESNQTVPLLPFPACLHVDRVSSCITASFSTRNWQFFWSISSFWTIFPQIIIYFLSSVTEICFLKPVDWTLFCLVLPLSSPKS